MSAKRKRAIAVQRRGLEWELGAAPRATPRAGDLYDRNAHTFEVLRRLGLGVSYDERRPVLVPMRYERPSARGRKNQ